MLDLVRFLSVVRFSDQADVKSLEWVGLVYIVSDVLCIIPQRNLAFQP